MTYVIRGVAAACTAVSSFFFAYWMGGALLAAVTPGNRWFPALCAALFAIAAGHFVWKRAGVSGSLANSVCTGAFVTGTITFAAGFFGPMLLAPDANQGPLLGLFITGPTGFVLGAIAGGMHWARQRLQLQT